MSDVTRGDYSRVAPEYYDAVRHPTSANFRQASEEIIDAWLPSDLTTSAIVDLGAGDSLVAKILARRGLGIDGLLIVDSSPTMLAYSDKWRSAGAHLHLADVSSLPLPDSSVAVAVASLGDPFNTHASWKEVRRVLRPKGVLIFTTPSFEWASEFRTARHEPPDAAEFALADGARVHVDSYIYPVNHQLQMMLKVGLRPVAVYTVLRSRFFGREVSPKIPSRPDLPVVTGYQALLTDPLPR